MYKVQKKILNFCTDFKIFVIIESFYCVNYDELNFIKKLQDKENQSGSILKIDKMIKIIPAPNNIPKKGNMIKLVIKNNPGN